MPPSRTAYFRRLITVAAAAVLVASALALSPPAAAQTQPFTDTSSDSYYSDAVAALADNGVFDGTECAEGMLCPNEPIDRKTMAVWTVRALDGQEPAPASGDGFTDVDPGSFHAPFIERMAELGVTSGCGDGSAFCPHDTVTRAQMAVFLTRGFNLDPGPDPGFTDVAPNAWYYNQTAALAASGITAGCGDGTTFCPNQPTNRAQMATFLARALGLVDKPTTATTDGADVTVGDGFACAVIADGTVDCWGRIGEAGSYILSLEAVRAAPGGSYVEVSATYPDAACALHALRSDGTLECWSEGPDSSENRLDGFADTTSFVVDDGINVPGGIFKSLDGSCAIRSDDSIECWGHEPLVSGVPQGTFKSLSSGWYHACGVRTDGTLACWGQHPEHYSNYGLGLESDVPQGTFTSVAVGFDHACAIRAEGTLACWGQNPDFPGLASRAPQGTFTSVTVGGVESCAIRTDATLACWGTDFQAMVLGSEQVFSPQGAYTAVALYRGWSPLDRSYISDAAGIVSDGTVSLWGSASWDCCG